MIKFIKRQLSNFYHLHGLMFETRQRVYELHQKMDDQNQLINDLITLNLSKKESPEPFTLKTDHPIALESNDHLYPWGTMQDNTRGQRFVKTCEIHFQKSLKTMDLGCSGGGLVQDFLMRGHRAIGLEGSDTSLRMQRAAWRLFPDHLKTADITKKFDVMDGGTRAQFDVISAWEVMEHISKDDLPQLLANIHNHLHDNGLFVASVATCPDVNAEGIDYHVTVEDRAWWVNFFEAHNLIESTNHPFITPDFVRGTGNGMMDWNVQTNPEFGFHIVLKKKDK